MPHRVGVCSWSLRPRSPEDLTERVRACGLSLVQLALDPIRTGAWDEARTVDVFRRAGLRLASGMMAMEGEDYSTLESIRRTGGVRPDSTWPANRAAAGENAALAQRLGLTRVTFHAGFIPHDAADPGRAAMLARLREMDGIFASRSVHVAFETGQESAQTLEGVLGEVPAAGVNFDPANMILYGMGDPVEALRRLAPRVMQLHVKDALPAPRPGEWGTEVPAGRGGVDWPRFFGAVREHLPDVDVIIEREAGEDREADVRAAAQLIARYVDVERP